MKRLISIITAPWRWLKTLGRWILAPFVWVKGRWRAVNNFFTEVPPDEPIGDTIARPFQGGEARAIFIQGLIENLQALRQHLFRAVIALTLTTVFSFLFADTLMKVLAVPMGNNVQEELFALIRLPVLEAFERFLMLGAEGIAQMQVIEPTESIGVFMRVSLLAGLALAMPWIVLEIYLFIAPGLMPPTRLKLLWAIPFASLMFILGLSFTYLVMLPTAVPFLMDFGGFRAAWRPAKYFELITGLMFWIGLAFQMPLAIYAMATLGWIRAKQLVEYWRIAVIVIAIIAAMVTPTVDPVNMGLVMLPMALLYGFSIIGARLAESNRSRAQAKTKAATA